MECINATNLRRKSGQRGTQQFFRSLLSPALHEAPRRPPRSPGMHENSTWQRPKIPNERAKYSPQTPLQSIIYKLM